MLLGQLKQINGDKELLFPRGHDATKVMSENTVNNLLVIWAMTGKLKFAGTDLEQWRVVL